REHRAGEGFSAQNSATLIVGLGAYQRVDAVHVRWPSGRVQQVAEVAAGMLVTVYENPRNSPTGVAFVVVPYRGVQP
ncbi:MAG: ASPIC/UnbV domain-containing protein, partial [Gemmatimonadota bacterium]|nr:ASPIC/UnbV domain-containing protein [Gemmatimonadota bacterium]